MIQVGDEEQKGEPEAIVAYLSAVYRTFSLCLQKNNISFTRADLGYG